MTPGLQMAPKTSIIIHILELGNPYSPLKRGMKVMRPDKWRRRNRESQKKQRPACNGQDRRSLSQPERVLTRDGCFTAEKGGTPVKVRHSTTPYSEKHTDSELARHGNSIDQDKVSLDVNMLQIRIAKATQEEIICCCAAALKRVAECASRMR